MAYLHDDCDRPPGDPGPMVASIVEQIRRQGYYLTWVSPRAHQDVIDVLWAAQFAGRALDAKAKTSVSKVCAPRPGRVAVMVTMARRTQDQVDPYSVIPAEVRELFIPWGRHGEAGT